MKSFNSALLIIAIQLIFLAISTSHLENSSCVFPNMDIRNPDDCKQKVLFDSNKILKFNIEIEEKEWDSIKPTKVQWKDRTTLSLQSSWTNLILDKIWGKFQLECPFPMQSHKFFKKKGYNYLQFSGKCDECKAPLKGYILEEPKSFPVSVTIETFDTRGLVHKKHRQLRNNKRTEAKQELKHMKAIKFKHIRANKCLNDSGSYKTTNNERPDLNTTAVLQKARQEAKAASGKLKGDAIGELVDMCLTSDFVRGFSTVPLVIYYWLQNQVNFWNELAPLDLSISIDASGRFTKALTLVEGHATAPIFFYNIVVRFLGHIYTLSQMLSSKHDVVQIATWLSKWAEDITVMPKQIDADGSTALLNAICVVFNHCSYEENNNQCVKFLTHDSSCDEVILLPACNVKRDRAHLMKAMAIWHCFKANNWIYKDFYLRVIGFSLEIEELDLLEDVIISVLVVSQSENETVAYKKAFSFLEEAVGTFDYALRYSENEKCEDCTEENCCIFQESETAEMQKAFEEEMETVTKLTEKENETGNRSDGHEAMKYILKLKERADEQLKKGSSHEGYPNDYYLPAIVTNLIRLYSQFPSWTNILNKFYAYGPKKVSTSCGSEIYYRISRIDYGFSTPASIKQFLPEQMHLIAGATKLGRRELKLHLQNRKEISSRVTNDKYSIVHGIAVTETKEPMLREVENKTANTDTVKSNLTSTQGSDQNDNMEEDTEKLIKKLFSITSTYLMIVKEFYNDLAHIPTLKLSLTLEGFQSLQNSKYIHDNVVDSFLIIESKRWPSASYIPARQTTFILGDQWDGKHGEQWNMYHLEVDCAGLLFLPYCRKEHWMLVILDLAKELVIFCDPLIPDTDIRKEFAKKAFQHYLSNCSDKNVLKHKNWKWRHPSVKLPKQAYWDKVNCGLYVMNYMNFFGGADRSSLTFEPTTYRRHVAAMLLNHRNSNTDVCLYCYNTDQDYFDSDTCVENNGVKECISCSRWAHVLCIKRNNAKLCTGTCEFC